MSLKQGVMNVQSLGYASFCINFIALDYVECHGW